MNGLFRQIRLYKDGIIIGGIVGLAAAAYAVSQGADLNSLVAGGKSLVDEFLGREADLLGSAQIKLYGVFIFMGSLVGYLSEKFIVGRRKRKRFFINRGRRR